MEAVFLNRTQLSEKLGCSVKTVDRMRKAGCPWLSLAGGVRFDWEAVVGWMAQQAAGK